MIKKKEKERNMTGPTVVAEKVYYRHCGRIWPDQGHLGESRVMGAE